MAGVYPQNTALPYTLTLTGNLTANMENPPFLEIEEFHLSKSEAKRNIITALLKQGIKSPKGGWERATYKISGKDYTFNDLYKSARKSGIIPFIQFEMDRTDEVFGGTRFGISTPTIGFNKVTSSYAGVTKELTPPMTDQPVEFEITKDIMFYREEACLYSKEYDFTFCTRYYRAYLSSCISLVDAFINRHILIYKFRGLNSEDFLQLQKTSRLEDRIGIFLKVSCGKDLTAINSGQEWIHFKKLRQLRNEMTHINSASLGYSIHEFADHFNYVRKGVGGLLKQIRIAQGKDSLTFIEKLRTAPFVYFNEITHRSDKKHIIKRRK
ncbi:hypothetical protein [Flavimarina sp. Hel_I_48]|uniref:hypothetical protein n=1 Tax=Flavimarina sp. Hel_I_48 TaxID=1392488 RepID=UPI0004DF78F6|nr:hypothetical protein [Flavimarina sp. Hel_I_48]